MKFSDAEDLVLDIKQDDDVLLTIPVKALYETIMSEDNRIICWYWDIDMVNALPDEADIQDICSCVKCIFCNHLKVRTK